MSGRRNPEISQIVIRHVRREGRFHHRERNEYYPGCRRHDHAPIGFAAVAWNVRFSYKAGGGQSLYWCDAHLPARYRTVADSMLRGKETMRVIRGEKLASVATDRPRRKEPMGTDRVPWKQLL